MLRQILVNSLIVSLGVSGVEVVRANPVETNPLISSEKTSNPQESDKLTILPELNPNPNPLILPTEQEIKESEEKLLPITLEQALELARRNSQQLKVALLQLDSSRSSLAEAEAALYPNLGLSAIATRAVSASGELGVIAQRKQQSQNVTDLQNQLQFSQGAVQALQDQVNSQQAVLNQLGGTNTGSSAPPGGNLTEEQQQQIELLSQVFVTRSEAGQFLTGTQAARSIQLEFLQRDLQQAQSTLEQNQQQLDTNIRNTALLGNYATTVIDGKLSLNYAIYSPARRATINAAQERVRFSELDVQRTEQQLNLDVALAYFDLQQADSQVLIFQNDVDDRTQRLQVIQVMLDAALATSLDLLSAQVDLDNAIQELSNAKATQESTRRNLARVLNLSPSVTPKSADPVKPIGEWQLPLDKTILLALKNRVELEQRLAEKRRSQAEQQIAFSATRPSLSLFAEYNLLNLATDDPSDFATRGTGDGYAVGLNFNWPFFDGGAANARARQAGANAAIAEQQYSDNAYSIRLQVEQSYYQLKPQLENIKTATGSVSRAREALRAAEIRFDAGVNTQTEVLDARNRLVRAQNNLVNAIITYNRSYAQLQRAIGVVKNN